MPRTPKVERLTFTERQWKILERALLKYSSTADDEGYGYKPATPEEIDTLYYRVKRRNEQRAALKEARCSAKAQQQTSGTPVSNADGSSNRTSR